MILSDQQKHVKSYSLISSNDGGEDKPNREQFTAPTNSKKLSKVKLMPLKIDSNSNFVNVSRNKLDQALSSINGSIVAK